MKKLIPLFYILFSLVIENCGKTQIDDKIIKSRISDIFPFEIKYDVKHDNGAEKRKYKNVAVAWSRIFPFEMEYYDVRQTDALPRFTKVDSAQLIQTLYQGQSILSSKKYSNFSYDYDFDVKKDFLP